MSFWKGTLTPTVTKHRDFEHGDVFTHLMGSGGSYQVDERHVMVRYDPIDDHLREPPDKYFFVDVGFGPGAEPYEFLVKSEPDLSRPSERRIAKSVNEILANPVAGGRDWMDSLDGDDEYTRNHPKVLARLAAGDWFRMGPPAPRRPAFSIDDLP